MRRYRAAKRAAGLRLVRRWIDAEPDATTVYSDHSRLEARSLAMHGIIAQRLRANPQLIAKASENLRRWASHAGEHPPAYLAEWQTLLEQPLPVVLAFITSTSATAIRLRQSTPFAGILTPLERKRLYEAFRA